MKVPETPQDVLYNAMEYIQLLGWNRGYYQRERKNGDGPVCAVGAVMLGAVDEGITNLDNLRSTAQQVALRDRAEEAMTEILRQRTGYAFMSIVRFNDEQKGRGPVITLMKDAIALLDKAQ